MFSIPSTGIHNCVSTGTSALERHASPALAGISKLSGQTGSWLLNNNGVASIGSPMGTGTPDHYNNDRKIFTPFFNGTSSYMYATTTSSPGVRGEGNYIYNLLGNEFPYGNMAAISMMVWFRLSIAQPVTQEVVMMADIGMMSGGTISLNLTSDLKLKCAINTPTTGANVVASSALSVDNTFHHAVGIWTSANGGSLFLYLDKILVASGTSKGAITIFANQMMGSSYMYLGCGQAEFIPTRSNYFAGDLSQAKFFGKRVGVDSITAIYNQGLANLAPYVDNRNNIVDYK